MQHLVIKYISQEPQRNERLVQRRIDANQPIFFLDSAKNELFSRSMSSPASPNHVVAAKTLAKVASVYVVKNRAQIEMGALVAQIQQPLHRQFRVRQFSFRILLFSSHCGAPKTKRDAVM